MRRVLAAVVFLPALLASGSNSRAGERAGAFSKDHPVATLKPGHWLEVPDSRMIKVAFKWPKGIRHGRIRSIMGAWCGGAYDTKRDRLLIWGGGHSDYAGNEVYAFDVKALKWERINAPSLNIDDGKGETYPDGSPRSGHTYDHLEYIPSIDRFVSMGIYAGYPHGSAGGPSVWQFDVETKTWETKSRRPGGSVPSGSAFDPVTGHEFLHTRNCSLFEWDPPADKWTQRGRGAAGGYKSMGVVDPIGRRYMSIGGGQIFLCDVSGQGKVRRQAVAPRGFQDIVEAYAPGLDYDPVLDKVVGWNGGADVFLLDLEKMEWEKVEAAEASKVIPTKACGTGTYGRFRYIPSMNAYIVVNDVKQSVYIYRLTKRGEQPIPKRFTEALKSKDAGLVKWVAGQVATWPKEEAQPGVKAALEAQKKSGRAEIAKLLEDVLKQLAASKE